MFSLSRSFGSEVIWSGRFDPALPIGSVLRFLCLDCGCLDLLFRRPWLHRVVCQFPNDGRTRLGLLVQRQSAPSAPKAVLQNRACPISWNSVWTSLNVSRAGRLVAPPCGMAKSQINAMVGSWYNSLLSRLDLLIAKPSVAASCAVSKRSPVAFRKASASSTRSKRSHGARRCSRSRRERPPLAPDEYHRDALSAASASKNLTTASGLFAILSERAMCAKESCPDRRASSARLCSRCSRRSMFALADVRAREAGIPIAGRETLPHLLEEWCLGYHLIDKLGSDLSNLIGKLYKSLTVGIGQINSRLRKDATTSGMARAAFNWSFRPVV
ncbi:zincin, partial [Aureobasidium melanogenum]